MTPSPAQLPPAAVAARPGAAAIGDAASQAVAAFAVLLAGVLPMPRIAAISGQSPLAVPKAPPSAGVSAPGATVAARSDQGPAPGVLAALPNGASAAAGPAGVSQGSEAVSAVRGGPAPATAERGREPSPPVGWSGAAAQQPAAPGPLAPGGLLPDADQPPGPPAPGPLASPGAAAGPADRARAVPQPAVGLQAHATTHAAGSAGRPRTPSAVATVPTAADPASRGLPLASAPAAAAAPAHEPTTAATESGQGGAAAKIVLALAPEARSPAAAEAEREPPAELGAVAPGRPGRAASEAAGPASRPPPPPPVVQLGIQIAGAAARRIERMVVQLEPAALGRVEVRLDFSHDNRVSALIAADRPDTLELLQRDSRALERSLQDAGLRLDDHALSFSLRQEQRGHERGTATRSAAPLAVAGAADDADPRDDAHPAHWIGARRVLDIRI